MRSGTVLTVILGVTGVGLVPVHQASATVPLCGSTARCHVVTRTDVNGDGRPDIVAITRRGATAAPDGSATIRVQTSPSHVESVTRSNSHWFGPLWQGAARIDARDGRELVLGATAGAHAQFFWVLTWRQGRLVTLRAPGGDRTWVVDGSATNILGWHRSDADPAGLIRQRVAERQSSGRVSGRVVTYRWSFAGWSRVGSRVVDPVSEGVASRWVGWRVPGLDVY
jgi:hypothetical protein